jgi:hypothetical protein
VIDPILSDWFFNYPHHDNYQALCERYHEEGREMDLIFKGEAKADEDDDWSEADEVTEAITKDAIQFMKDNSIIIEEYFPQFVGAAEKLADDFMRRFVECSPMKCLKT